MRLAATIATIYGSVSAVATAVVLLAGRAAATAGNRLLAMPDEAPLFDLMDAEPEPAPHPEPCIEPAWKLDRDPGHPVGLSFVPTRDGCMAVFACDTEDFVAARLTRDEVQALRFGLTTWLCDTAAVIGR